MLKVVGFETLRLYHHIPSIQEVVSYVFLRRISRLHISLLPIEQQERSGRLLSEMDI